jgi:metallo-beta-lactamase family protein
MFQGGKTLEERNRDVHSYHPEELSFILLTHAHIDHSGLIPKLVKEGFRGRVICTKATFDLCEVMLKDSGHIQEMEAAWQSRKNERSGREGTDPLYTAEEAEKSLRYFQRVGYDEILSLSDGLKVRFQDAGHILGSAIIEIWVDDEGHERRLVFSGDLGGSGQPIIRDPSPVEEADVLWLESTYGDRLHKSREETIQELLKISLEAISQQAKVVIPAFAVERTQDILYTIGQLIRKDLIPSIPIYIDSPLAISATEIFKKNPDCFDEEMKGLLLGGEDPLELSEIKYTQTTEESKAINEDPRSAMIISASGMCDSGRIQHHLKHHLWRKESHIVFIGYQAEGTVGRRIIDGAKTIRVLGEEIAVRAHIHTLGGFSAHADQKGLLEWLSHFRNPDLQVFVNHGEEKISMALSKIIHQKFKLGAVVPQWGEKKVLFTLLRSSSERSGICFGGFRPTKHVEEPQASARGGFTPAGRIIPEEKMEAVESPEERWSSLSKNLDRVYKKLRRKLRMRRSKRADRRDAEWLKELEEVNKKLAELESELE